MGTVRSAGLPVTAMGYLHSFGEHKLRNEVLVVSRLALRWAAKRPHSRQCGFIWHTEALDLGAASQPSAGQACSPQSYVSAFKICGYLCCDCVGIVASDISDKSFRLSLGTCLNSLPRSLKNGDRDLNSMPVQQRRIGLRFNNEVSGCRRSAPKYSHASWAGVDFNVQIHRSGIDT